MIAKIWQKLGIFILIVACIFNIMVKIVTKISLQQELSSAASSFREAEKQDKKNEVFS